MNTRKVATDSQIGDNESPPMPRGGLVSIVRAELVEVFSRVRIKLGMP